MALNPLNTIYKEINGSKITSDLYLPQSDSTSPQRFPVGKLSPIVYNIVNESMGVDSRLKKLTRRSDQYPWRRFYARPLTHGLPLPDR